jgi:nucleotide-binding universal stress UspA family protein
MPAKRILCPIDFSPCSSAALQRASTLAAESGAKLYVVHVEPIAARHPQDPPEFDAHRRLLAEGKPTCDVPYEQHCLRGDVTEELLHFASVREIDLIVVGTHGRGGLVKSLLGSVAESLSRLSSCTVTIVRPPDSHAALAAHLGAPQHIEHLADTVEKLRRNLDNEEALEQEHRDALREVASEIDKLQQGEVDFEHVTSVHERIAEVVLRMETQHPKITSVLSQITNLLAGIGI